MKQSGRRLQQLIPSSLTGRIVAIGALVIGVTALGVMVYNWPQTSVIDRSLVATADFSVYAPQQPPAGYTLQSDQTQLSGTILTYRFYSEQDNKTLTVTVQRHPDGFDVSQIAKGGSVTSTTTGNGTLYDLSLSRASQYLLDTGDALVYLTSVDQIDTATIHALAQSLRKVN